MLFLRLWNYIRGYVIIIVEGYFLEKFINICTHRQIMLWDVKRQKNCIMTAKASIKGFKLLRPVARKTGCRVRIKKKKGLPFVLFRYRKRKTFIVGAGIFVVLFFTMTSFVWTVDISGNKKLDVKIIEENLAQLGVKPGILKYSVDANRLANEMMLKMNDLAWIGISLKGTKIKVEVAERVKPPELVPKNIPCDIIAFKDGIILTVAAKEGKTVVKPGDTVVKGQVLISGTVTPSEDDTKFEPRKVHAMGTVKARTWYEKSCKVEAKIIENERTGKKKDKYSLKLFTKRFGFFSSRIPFENYEKVEIRKRLSIGENLVFPFEFKIDRYYESISVEKEIDLEAAKQIAADKAYNDTLTEIPANAEIVKTDLRFIENDDGSIIANEIIECIEDIGYTKEIGGE